MAASSLMQHFTGLMSAQVWSHWHALVLLERFTGLSETAGDQ